MGEIQNPICTHGVVGCARIEQSEVVCNIVVSLNNKQFTLEPKPDITPLESARLTQWMVAHLTNRGPCRPNYTFLETHNLLRHFKPENQAPTR